MMLFIFSAFTLAGNVLAQVAPIPTRPDGVRWDGYASSPVQLEIFLDPLCPDSRDAWPIVTQVSKHYQDDVSLLVHVFPLPYHRYSFSASQVIVGLYERFGTHLFFAYLEALFPQQINFSNEATFNITPTAVYDIFAQVGPQVGVSTGVIRDMLSSASADSDTRTSWKYGTTREVCGTPIFFINGVNINGDARMRIEDWIKIIDPLLLIWR